MSDNRLRELKERYRGRIDVSATGQGGLDSNAAISELFREWSPLFIEVSHLLEVLGPPTERSAEALSYRFDGGRVGGLWTIYVEGDFVTGFRHTPLD